MSSNLPVMQCQAVIVGGGPAGLMAAEVLAQAGLQVDLFDAMPSVGRKFLLAGVGGMNITHAEPAELFRRRYGDRCTELSALLDDFGNVLGKFVKVMPRDYAKALKQLEAERQAAASVAAE